jgi:hypothetical protein
MATQKTSIFTYNGCEIEDTFAEMYVGGTGFNYCGKPEMG